MLTDFLQFVPRLLALAMIAFVVVGFIRNWKRFAPTPDLIEERTNNLCAYCGYDVRGGLAKCPECGRETGAVHRRKIADLRARLPAGAIGIRTPDPDEFPTVVFNTEFGGLAMLLLEHLEKRGIKTHIILPGRGDPVTLLPVAVKHRLVVWTADQERAEAMIASLWPAEEVIE